MTSQSTDTTASDAEIVYITVFVFVGMGFLLGGFYACNARLVASKQAQKDAVDQAVESAGVTVPEGVQVTMDYDESGGVTVDIEDGNGGVVDVDQVIAVANGTLIAL